MSFSHWCFVGNKMEERNEIPNIFPTELRITHSLLLSVSLLYNHKSVPHETTPPGLFSWTEASFWSGSLRDRPPTTAWRSESWETPTGLPKAPHRSQVGTFPRVAEWCEIYVRNLKERERERDRERERELEKQKKESLSSSLSYLC